MMRDSLKRYFHSCFVFSLTFLFSWVLLSFYQIYDGRRSAQRTCNRLSAYEVIRYHHR